MEPPQVKMRGVLRAWGGKDQCFWCVMPADEDQGVAERRASTFVGNGDALRRVVLSVIATLVLLICFACIHAALRIVPRTAQSVQDRWKLVSKSLQAEGGAVLESVTNVTVIEPEDTAGPRALRPRNPPGSWVTNDDYPVAAQRAGQQGTVAFTLLIDARGIPTRCDVTASSGFPTLDNTACNLLTERARFVPALDANGRAIPAIFTSRFKWVLEE